MEHDRPASLIGIVDEALSDFGNGDLYSLWRTGYVDDPFGGIGEHVLRSRHTSARSVLDLFDLGALFADDAAHVTVRDEKANGSGGLRDGGRCRTRGGASERVFEEGVGDEGVELGELQW